MSKQQHQLDIVNNFVRSCTKCDLCSTRKYTVFGEGNPNADIIFVGEAPGAKEDETGIPFCGRSGELLTRMINAMGFARNDVYICNVVKCRPPSNRNPSDDEIQECIHYLETQLHLIQPRVICTLGLIATQALLKTKKKMFELRSKIHEYKGIPVIATYHPAYLLRSPSKKKCAWQDLQLVMEQINGQTSDDILV